MQTSLHIVEESPVHWFQCIKSSCWICSFDVLILEDLNGLLRLNNFSSKCFQFWECFFKFALFPGWHKSVSSSLIYCKSSFQYKFKGSTISCCAEGSWILFTSECSKECAMLVWVKCGNFGGLIWEAPYHLLKGLGEMSVRGQRNVNEGEKKNQFAL